MSIERIYHCDGPANTEIPDPPEEDRCPCHVRTATPPPYLPGGFIRVEWGDAARGEETYHFCSWGCVMRFAAKAPVPEYYDMDGKRLGEPEEDEK